jgi:hypothetical protein
MMSYKVAILGGVGDLGASRELIERVIVHAAIRARSKRVLNTVALIRPFETPQVL